MPKYFTPKQERMYEHVKDSTGSKRVAAATVNKFRSKHGLTKKKKGKAVDEEAMAVHVAGTGKSYNIEGPVRAKARAMKKVVGTKQPETPRQAAPTPRSSAVKPAKKSRQGDEVSSLHIGGKIMKGTFESIFKGQSKSGNLKKAETDDEESSELEESVVAKGEDDEEEEISEDEESGEVAKGGDEDEEGEECFACPNCASDITVTDVKNAIQKGEIHRKGVGGSPKGKQKHGEKKPARTAVTEMHGGGTSHNGKPKAGTKTPTRGVQGVSRQNNAGNVGSYAKGGFGSPLMSIVKSEGPAGDEAVAREIAKMHGVPFEEVAGDTEQADEE